MSTEIKKSKYFISNNQLLQRITDSFNISLSEMRKISQDFYLQMINGLSGRKSSLKMVPTYVDKPTGREEGKFIALDLGGTNLRILQIELKGKGRTSSLGEEKFVLKKKQITGKANVLFDFIASCLKKFSREQNIRREEKISVGFTFSFPVQQTGIARGRLLHWTKDFSAQGVEGEDVVQLLNQALFRKGLNNIRIACLINDTVATLATLAYQDRHCDIGVILGTGTNACYRERLSEIRKWRGKKTPTGKMLVNIEWGNFNQLGLTNYDRLLDRQSENPGEQILEKMVSGKYLGEITRLIVQDFLKRKMLFDGRGYVVLDTPKAFKTEYMSKIEADSSEDLSQTKVFLRKLGILNSKLAERRLMKKVCQLVSRRGARISAAALASVITKIDPTLAKKHTIAIDGSLYEKHPGFAKNLKSALEELFKRKVSRIKMVLTKDGSATGAAIVAAWAHSIRD